MAQPIQQGVEGGQLDYYDIMVIGKTGMGKSTTVDKMIIAELRDVREERSSAVQQAEPVYNEISHKLKKEDFTMWLVSDKPSDSEPSCHDDNYEIMRSRLKNLINFQCVENPHLEINKAHDAKMSIYESTLECEVLSNDQTKIRVLDVPGFFGRVAAGDEEALHQRTQACAESALSTMRKVLHIKNAHNLKIRRIVYFLPEHGALNRTSQSLIVELQIMERHFGRAIFDSMVVITTVPPMMYKRVNADTVLFDDEEFEQAKRHLQEALKVVFKGNNVPEPPIEFISLFDTCEVVLEKVKNAKVLKESLSLKLRSSICARCGVKVVKEGEESAYCEFPNSEGVIPHEESTCHPMMIPKRPILKKFLNGIYYILVLVGKKEIIETLDEVCVECKQPPSSRGCMKINTEYCGAKISHSSSTKEIYQVINMEGPVEEVVAVGQGAEGTNIPAGVVTDFPMVPMGGFQEDNVSTISQDENQPQDPDFDVRG